MKRRWLVGFGCGLWWTVSGCTHTPPPILFHSDAGQHAAPDEGTPVAVDAGPVADAGHAAALLSNAVPGDGTSLTIDGQTVRANPGEHFTRYVALDPDADNDRDVVVLRARADGAIAGVGFYRRDPAAYASVNVTGGDTPTDPRCTDANVRSTSPRSVIVTYRCPPPPAAPAPGEPAPPPSTFVAEHLVVALTPLAQARMRIAEMPTLAGTVMDVAIETGDRDADGRDDIVASVGARGQTDRADSAARANVVFLDRPAGVARDTSEPEASFARLVAAARSAISRRGGSTGATERMIRLRRVLCSDAGAARVRFGGESGVNCAGSAALRGLPDVYARGLVASGEISAAIAATRPESAIEFGVASATRLAADLRRVLPVQTNVTARRGPFASATLATASTPRASALTLEPSNNPTSIVVHAEPATRIDLNSLGPNADPSASTDPRVRSADGARVLAGFFETCDGIVAAICPSAAIDCLNAPPRADAMPPGAESWRISDLIAAEHAAVCLREGAANVPAMRPQQIRPIGFNADALMVAWRGRLLRVAPNGASVTPVLTATPLGAFAPGSSGSASGQQLAMPGIDGVLVRDGTGHWHTWSDPQLVGRYAQMSDLTVSDDGRTLAGFVGTQLWVLQHDVMRLAPPTLTPIAPGEAPAPAAALIAPVAPVVPAVPTP